MCSKGVGRESSIFKGLRQISLRPFIYYCLFFSKLISITALSPSPGSLCASLGVSIPELKVQPCARAKYLPFFPGTALLHSALSLHTLLFLPGMSSLFGLDELSLWETAQ